MTDKVKGFVVVLDKDMRIDDVQHIKDAISMIKGVAIVEEAVAGAEDSITEMRVKSQLRGDLYDFIKEKL